MKKLINTIVLLIMGHSVLAQEIYPPTGQSTYVVTAGQDITVTNASSITLKPGVHIQSGAVFHANIQEINSANDPYRTITPSTDENYIYTRSFYSPMSSFSANGTKEGEVQETITYFDGLGRPMQQIAIKATPQKEDLVTHIAYDSLGRQKKEWLPYPEDDNRPGEYRGPVGGTAQGFYKLQYPEYGSVNLPEVNPYSEKAFEASPLHRVLKQAAPGWDWRMGEGHEIELGYGTNGANTIRHFGVNLSLTGDMYEPTLDNKGYYVAAELQKTITRDENHSSGTEHTMEEFVDKQGRVVLKRTYNNGAHDTYYVYDDFGNLTYVIPPKVTTGSVSTAELNELCYQYKYDHRNRLVEKKLPGKGWESIVYNTLDRPVLTQDAVQDGNYEWLFTKYDAFGRVAYTGLHTQPGDTDRPTMQGYADNTSNYDQYEAQQGSSNILAGTPVHYSNNTIPQAITKVYTINYYDGYMDTDGLSVPSIVLGQATATNVKGLATVNKVRVLGTNDWITTITGYDDKGRTIYTASKNNYLNTTDIVETELDFGGKVLQTKTTHQRAGFSNVVTEDRFTYDHQGRLLTQKQEINGGTNETLLRNSYDELGQLSQKIVGGGLQIINYEYNIRGWLKAINDPNTLGDDLWGMEIEYNRPSYYGRSITPLYNGNISQIMWNSANSGSSTYYNYEYDALNRIVKATDAADRYSLSNVTYDKNGNILTLDRKGHTNTAATTFGWMDRLTYGYHNGGNRLRNVADNNASDTYGFKDVNGSGEEYGYDANGNMTSDLNKGIDNVSYNHLNLPTGLSNDILLGSMNYIYDAMGNKLEKYVAGAGIPGTTTQYAGNYIYENNTLQFFNHPEGYVNANGGSYEYVYQFKDYLGNVRLTYADSNNDGTIDDSTEIISEKNYYPFGLEHKGYNTVISPNANSTAEKWKFQGQELAENLGLNTYEFKYRMHDPAIGRFWQIDPLAEDFMYNSPYAFSENKVISHFELEGLEAVLAITMGKDVRYRGGIIEQANSDAQHINIQSGGVNSFVDAFKTASASDPNGIGFVAIWGHGIPGNIWGSGSTGNTSISTSDLSALNDAIKNGDISFAENAVIYIGNCNSGTCGSGDPASFAQTLSNITGVTVIGANDSVGLGYPTPNLENVNTMEFTVWDASSKEFISFEQANSRGIGPNVDVIGLMNRTINPPQKVNGVSRGVNLPSTTGPTATTLRANAGARPIGYGRDEYGNYGPIFPNTPNDNRWH